MFKWIQQYREASRPTKVFIWNWFIYGLLIIVSTVYVYARLDWVRSYVTKPAKQTETPAK